MKGTQLDLFRNPLYIYQINVGSAQEEELIKDCYRWSKESKGLNISNVNGWHSESALFRRSENSFKSLSSVLIESVNEASASFIPDFDHTKYLCEGQGWVNINSKYSFNAPHMHPSFIWSGVYYLKVPISDNKNSGKIQFLDPRSGIESFSNGIIEFQKAFSSNFSIQPQQHMLLIFPSWLSHWVLPNETTEDRISIAFNIRYKSKS
tara:strand:- start:187 stop:807 length:621 start_codon:yes stop_codon:yes gene_type:complete